MRFSFRRSAPSTQLERIAPVGEQPLPDLAPEPGRWSWRRLLPTGRRLEITALMPALLIATLLAPHVANFAGRDDYERELVPLAVGWRNLEAIEGRLYDARFSARGKITPASAKDIAIVAIDQSSLSAQGQWPWPRRWHAQLVRRLKAAGARVIVFDISFDSKQNPKPSGELSADDAALVAACEEAGNVLISAGFQPQVKSAGAGNSAAVNTTTAPFDELDSTTPDIGFNWTPENAVGEKRRYAWRAKVSGAEVASLSALAVGSFQKKLDGDENKGFFKVLGSDKWPNARGEEVPVPLSPMRVGEDMVWTTPVFYWGPPGSFPTYSYSDVLNGKSGEWTPAKLREKFNGRIVFIGGTASILKDVFAAPVFADTEGGAAGTQIAGVEMHASVAAQALEGRFIHSQDARNTLLWLFGMSLGGALWIAVLRLYVSRWARLAQARWIKWGLPGRVHSAVWFGSYAFLGGLPVLAFWAWAQWVFAHRDFWIVAVYPLMGAVVSSGAALLLFFVAEAGERRKVVARLSRHVSRDVMDEILSSPEEEDPRPYRAVITVLFSDLEGFTAFASNHSPDEVVEALNAYMTRMVTVVSDHGGTVDKFIGDAVMAFFGAPVPRFDHAARALACAVAMQDECAKFRRETGIQFYMRVGVHSGEAIVGYMGSTERADYTVIGDTVNLASRLEAKNKDLRARIVCSDASYSLAPEVVEAIPTPVSVRGVSETVNIWIVRGLKGLPVEEEWRPAAITGGGEGGGGEGQNGESSAEPQSLMPAPAALMTSDAGSDAVDEAEEKLGKSTSKGQNRLNGEGVVESEAAAGSTST
jgi:adenylate cyclase